MYFRGKLAKTQRVISESVATGFNKVNEQLKIFRLYFLLKVKFTKIFWLRSKI